MDTFQFYGFIINHRCRVLRVSPFYWSESTQMLVEDAHCFKEWLETFIILIVYLQFLTYGLVIYIRDFEVDQVLTISFHSLNILGYVSAACDKINYARHRALYVQCVNSWAKYFTKIATGTL